MRDTTCMKVLLWGPENSGKTALLRNVMHKSPETTYEQTIGMGFGFREDQQMPFKAHFYDLSGAKRFQFIANNLLQERRINCILLIVDNTDPTGSLVFIRDTFCELDKAYNKGHAASKPAVGLLVNKRVTSSTVSENQLYSVIAEHYCDRLQFIHCCSVLDTEYSDILFRKLAEMSGAFAKADHGPEQMPQSWGNYVPDVSGYFTSFWQKKSGEPLLIAASPEKEQEKQNTTQLSVS